MSNPGTDVATRARCLALAQGSNAEIAAGLVVEFGLSWDKAQERVAELSVELQTMRFAGRMLVKERLYRLTNGEDLGKHKGEHLHALQTFGKAYLGLEMREEAAKLLEEAEKKLAKGMKPGLKVAG